MVTTSAQETSIRRHFRSVNAFTNREALVGGAYADASKLADRQAIYRFVERPWPADGGRVLGAVGPLRGEELVVDVGCGNGNDQRDLRAAGHAGVIVGFDLSIGMLRTLPAGAPAAVADAASLPLPDGAADLALAMHMLYHCPDIAAVVAELRRVVRRPGGALVVSTNSVDHLRELRELWTSVLSSEAGELVTPWQAAATRFSLEDAPGVLAVSFDEVEVQRTDNRLLVPSVEPVVAYVASTRDLSGAGLSDERWEAALARLADEVAAIISTEGALALTVVKGVLVAR